jgi:hypothetical protein
MVAVDVFTIANVSNNVTYIVFQLLGLLCLCGQAFYNRSYYNQRVNILRASFASAALAAMISSTFSIVFPITNSWLVLLLPSTGFGFVFGGICSFIIQRQDSRSTILLWHRYHRKDAAPQPSTFDPSSESSGLIEHSSTNKRKAMRKSVFAAETEPKSMSFSKIRSGAFLPSVLGNANLAQCEEKGNPFARYQSSEVLELLNEKPVIKNKNVFRSPLHVATCTCVLISIRLMILSYYFVT